MKLLKIVCGILIGAIAFGITSELKARDQYESEAKEIPRLIAELKSLRAPLDSDELDDQYPIYGIWTEAEKSKILDLPDYNPNTSSMGTAWDIFWNASRRDLPYLRKYLTGSKELRQQVLLTKSNLRFRDDDKPLTSKLPREFLLAAMEASYSGKSSQVIANLDAIRAICNYLIGSKSPWMASDPIEILLKGVIHLYEVNPSLEPKLVAWLNQPDFFSKPNVALQIKDQFLLDLIMRVQVDTPLLDKFRPPQFLRRWWKPPTTDQIYDDCKEVQTNYVPKSHVARHLMAATLRGWVKAFRKLKDTSNEDYTEVIRLAERAHDFDGINAQDFKGLCERVSESYYTETDFKEFSDLRLVLAAILSAHSARHLHNLESLALPKSIDLSLLDLSVSKRTFRLKVTSRSKYFTPQLFSIPAIDSVGSVYKGGIKKMVNDPKWTQRILLMPEEDVFSP